MSVEGTPPISEVVVDPERQKQAKAYARIQHRLTLGELVFGVAYAVGWLALGWSVNLREALLSWTTNPWLLVGFFGLVFGGLYGLLLLPVTYYEGFVLPRRFGLSTQTLPAWMTDQVKMIFIGGLLGGLVLEIMYAVLRFVPESWWIWAAGILLFFNVVLASLAPILLLPLFNKFTPLGDEYAELSKRLTRLAEQANTHVEGVFKFDMSRRTSAANAALTGLGKTRRIVLGDTLLQEFPPDEIEGVLAHELGHHVHKDIPVGILVDSVITLVGLWLLSLVLDWGVNAFGFSGPDDVAAMPLFFLILGAYGLIIMPSMNAYSRWRERRADEYALRATKNGPAIASALARLANQNLSDADPEPWVEFFLYSHPALSKRIAMAKRYSP